MRSKKYVSAFASRGRRRKSSMISIRCSSLPDLVQVTLLLFFGIYAVGWIRETKEVAIASSIFLFAFAQQSTEGNVDNGNNTNNEQEGTNVVVDCDPCIDRSQYTIQVVLHYQNVSDMNDDAYSNDFAIATSSMEQAARDMGVNLITTAVSLDANASYTAAMVNSIKMALNDSTIDALIVTVPNNDIASTIKDIRNVNNSANKLQRKPMFGLNVGSKLAEEMKLQGYIDGGDGSGIDVLDEVDDVSSSVVLSIGHVAAMEFLKYNFSSINNTSTTKTISTTTFRAAAYVDSIIESPYDRENQFETFTKTLLANNVTIVSRIAIDPNATSEHERLIELLFDGCPYQAVLLNSKRSVSIALDARQRHGCADSTPIGVTHVSQSIYYELSIENLLFAIDSQLYIRSAMAVVLATLYITTGKKLTFTENQSYLSSGPVVVTSKTVPSDSLQTCQTQGFPVCLDNSIDSVDTTFTATGTNSSNTTGGGSTVCECVDRSLIKIGGVIHGVKTDKFWDPVVSASQQAATDMGITLDLIQFEDNDINFIQEQMAARTRSLCESGDIDGIFVTIPGNITVIESVQLCLDLKVPVISINTGFEIPEQLNVLHHLAQDDFTAGFEAGKRLLMSGMRFGYCLDHTPGLDVLAERCKGFEKAINASSSSALFMGKISVPLDNRAKYKVDVESFVGSTPSSDDWEGIGLLSLGQVQIESLRDVVSSHPGLIAGTFDVGDVILDAITDGIVLFGIDQQPFFQGTLPVYLLTYLAHTKQRFLNRRIGTGPYFVTTPPTETQLMCESTNYEVCSLSENYTGSDVGNTDDQDTDVSVDESDNTDGNVEIVKFASPVIDLDCDPCIDRKVYKLYAVLHGRSDDEVWQQAVASMRQAALDMRVVLIIDLMGTIDDEEATSKNMAKQIRKARFDDSIHGIIVTIPDSNVETTIKEISQQPEPKPVFGMNVGFQVAPSIGLQGFIGRNDLAIGTACGEAFLSYFENKSLHIFAAVYVESALELKVSNKDRLTALQKVLGDASNKTAVVDSIRVNPSNLAQHDEQVKKLFINCPYQAVLLGALESVSIALAAKIDNNCNNTQIGVVNVNRDVYKFITKGSLLFGIDEGIYLQGALSVVLAAVYITTGKGIVLPVQDKAYYTEATVVTRQNVPSDTIQKCQSEAFPICDGYVDPILHKGGCACTDRSLIQIRGVLHGDTSDAFWDPVYSSAAQAAVDMGIDYENKRFEPQTNSTILHEQMAAKIRTLCQAGIDGLFVTIPSTEVSDAIKSCLQLKVPVVSINTGQESSESLGLYHHIAQVEYNGGLQAANALMDAGMKEGFCLDHAPGNPGTAARCRGFEDAIKASNGRAIVKGTFPVVPDMADQYKIDVEGFVDKEGDWDGIGILSMGPPQISGIQGLIAVRSNVIAGTFDLSPEIYEGVAEGWLKFGIDQQPFVQGALPVYLLTYLFYSGIALWNHNIESGPKLVSTIPNAMEVLCTENNYEVCIDSPDENMNYIPDGFLWFGYSMFGLISLMCIGTAIWTYLNRMKWVVKVSQPILLILIIIGCFVSSLSIMFLGVQTGYRNEQDSATRLPTGEVNPDIHLADASCMAVPWLYGMGFVLSFSTLFAKIQRVKMIYLAGLRMERTTVGIKDVVHVMAVVLIIELCILTTWQFVSPLRWERTVQIEDNGFPVESVGGCSYEDSWIFYVILVAFHVICLFYALALCFQTKDINSDFAETSYISLAVAFMFQVLVLSVPITALVRESTNVFYFVRVSAIFLQNFIVLALLFIPKMIKHHFGTGPEASTSGFSSSMSRNNLGKSRAQLGVRNSMRNSRSVNFSSEGMGSTGFQLQEASSLHSRNKIVVFPESSKENNLDTSEPFYKSQTESREEGKSVSSRLSTVSVVASMVSLAASNWAALGFESEQHAQEYIGNMFPLSPTKNASVETENLVSEQE